MATADHRRPSLVTEEFRVSLAERLRPLGFEARAQHKSLVRKVGKNLHRVDFTSSYRNAPGYAVVWPALHFEDAATRKLLKGWRAGGLLSTGLFALSVPNNVAESADAAKLADVVVAELAFFDWMEDPAAVLREVSRRYVPGLLDPLTIAPFLRARLGVGAVHAYATALLTGRPELAPAFATELAAPDGTAEAPANLDHGTLLARGVRAFGGGLSVAVPSDTVTSVAKTARHLRCFFGRQLRAWGEPRQAGELRRIGDDAIHAVRKQQEAFGPSIVDNKASARLILALTGDDRDPARQVPSPRLFQYHVLHAEPWG